MLIPIERRGAKPVFRQIVDYLRRAIEAGRLPAGTKLAPIRVLANELGVNRETVADAYRELESLGLTESGVGRGTFVLARPADRGATPGFTPPPPAFVPVLSRAAEAVSARLVVDYRAEPDAVHLERLVPDPSLYPVEAFRRCLNHVLKRGGSGLLEYGDARGHEELRRVLVARLAASGIEADPDDVVLTSGSTQGLALVARAFCDPGDAVAVEEPTYAGAYATFSALGLRPVPVPMLADGLDLDALDAVLARSRARLVYTMPTFQNPTGIATALEHRRRLLDVTVRHGVPVLEDDFEKDMRVRGRPVPPLRALDRTGHVVYVGTFSKALFPGVRVGWVLGGRRVMPALMELKRATDLACPPVVQAALAHFCLSGDYDRHLRTVGRELAQRLDTGFAALAAHLPDGSTFTRPEGGLSTWVTLPEAIDTAALLPAARQAGVVYAPGRIFYADGRASSALRLSVAQAAPAAVERGVRALGTVARAALPRGRRTQPARAVEPVHV